MARLIIPAVIVFFYFSLLLSSSQAGPPVTSTEDHVTDLPSANFNEEDVTDLTPLIALPTSNLLNSDDVSSVNVEKNRPDSENFAGEFQEVDTQAMKSFDDGEKRLEEFHPTANWGPMNRRFERMRAIRCRHRSPRFGGGAQIRPQMPFWKEDDEHHRRHHHGDIFPSRKFDEPRFHEADPARFADVSGDGRMIGEFKQPHFFFRHHHHHHHRHHHGDDEDRFPHGEEEEMEEEREHHRHRRGHGLWMRIRKFLGPF